MEEGFDGDAGAVGAETFVVLAVTFVLGVYGIEAGDTVEVVAAVFAQGITEVFARFVHFYAVGLLM